MDLIAAFRAATRNFLEENWPDLACPACRQGALKLEGCTVIESAQSKRERDWVHWDPEWIRGVFHAELRCGRGRCGEVAVAVGTMSVDVVTDDRGWEYATFLKLQHVSPPLPLALLPDECPGSVKSALDAASAVLLVDPGAAAERLRLALDDLLTAQKVPRFTPGAGRQRLTTHQRITKLEASKPYLADVLEAVKWVGNQGAHERTLQVTDVLNAVELFAHALEILYDERARRLARTAKQINSKKGIPRKRG